ncbi:type IV secretory system conjugative DNA transfer family protein [Aquimarina macrocephali]|uniref:type IV secretory system conjugative DNA transfer family protein n=1 Tax=Aquimarina macrocephali TaxID=666563 RepID=UPI003F671FB1
MMHIFLKIHSGIEVVIILINLLAMIQIYQWLRTEVGMIHSIILSFILSLVILLMIAPALIFIGIVFIVINSIKAYKYFKKNKGKKVIEEIKQDNPDSIYLDSEKGIIEIGNPYTGILIQGSAGSGKSRSLFYPIIKQFVENDFSGIIYDFKAPELSEFAYSFYNPDSKVKFAFLNFKDASNSVRVNPLSPKYLTKQAVAFEMATILINNLLPESIKKKDYWTRSSISVIAGAIWYLRNNHPDLCTLPHLIAMILFFPSVQLISMLSSDIETAGMISSLKEAHEMNAEKQIAGVVGTIKNALAQLNIPEIFYLLSDDEINLDLNNKETPTFLAIGNDSTLSNTYAPVISLIIGTCVRQMNQPNKHRSTVILDEISTLYIPDFEQIPATARSNRVASVVGLQDHSQMLDKYGAEKAQVLISNLSNQFYGRTVNEKTADMIVKLFGKHDVTYNSTSSSSGSSSGGFLSGNFSESNNTSVSQSIQQRERVKVSDIINLSAGKFYGTIAEGNMTELIGVQLKQVPDSKKEFENIEQTILPDQVFKNIYEDVKSLSKEKTTDLDDSQDFKIELN